MYWRSDICDNVMYKEFRNNHLQSRFHKRLAISFIRKYIINNPKPSKIIDIIKNDLRIHYKKDNNFQVILSMKFLMSSNQIKFVRKQQPCPHNKQVINTLLFSETKIIKEQLCARILELTITFVSRFENIRFSHYLIKPKSMLDWKLLALLDKIPKVVNSFDYKRYNHPFFQEFFDI